MTRRRLTALAAFLWTLCAMPAGAEVRERVLPNGLRVLFAPDAAASAVDVAVWYATGPADEPAGRTGLTHLVERLMFRGSAKFPDGAYAKRLGEAGASFNTFLAPDFSEFFSTGPAGALETLLAAEADRMAGLRLTAATVAAETRKLRDEHSRMSEVPLTHGLQQLYASAFGSHPYARPLQGRSADAARLTLATVTEYTRGRYGPGNALLTVTGAFEPDSAESLVSRTFGAIPARPTAPVAAAAEVPTGERRGRLRLPARLLMAGWTAPPDSVCGAEMAVIAHVLGSGARGRLTAELVRRQRLVASANCAYDGRRRASFIYAAAVVPPQADSVAAEDSLLFEVERAGREPFGDADIEAARKALLLAGRVERAGVRGRAHSLGTAELTLGHWSRGDDRLERLARLTPEDVRKVAERVLRPENRTVVWGTPTAAPARPSPKPAAAPAGSKGGRP